MIVQNHCMILQIIERHARPREGKMEATTTGQVEGEVQRVQASRDELVKRIAQTVPTDGTVVPLEGLQFHCASSPTELGRGVSYPAFCVIAQGSKEVLLGDNRYQYDPAHYLIVTATLPIASRIIEASPEKPYLSLILKLEPTSVGSVMIEAGYPAPHNQSGVQAINVSPLDADLLDAVVRLVRLTTSPSEARFLAPLVTREIIDRLLTGAQGNRPRYVTALGGNTHRIAEAIAQLRKDFDQPLRSEEVARDLGMSVSGFHHHFKAVTAMSPLQFQKQMRLQEARRLMLGEQLDATSAGYRVGYDDASHFNREYKRLFGEPSLRDVERLQRGATESAGL
jgi:AraC-like DNA-binding protein